MFSARLRACRVAARRDEPVLARRTASAVRPRRGSRERLEKARRIYHAARPVCPDEMKMVYASPTMNAPCFRVKSTLPWLMAIAVVAVGGSSPDRVLAQQRPAARAAESGALDTIQY